MAFRKNEETGQYSNTILVKPDRSNRVPFIKTPLLKPRGGLWGFITDLLRGGPNPFLASPLAVDIDRRIGVEKNAKRANQTGDPEAADAVIESADIALKNRWQESANRADSELDRLDTFLKEEEDWLENCRPRTIRAALEAELGAIKSKVSGKLGTLAVAEAKSRLELDHFTKERQIERSTHWGEALTSKTIVLIIAITVFEFILNTLFFSGTQRSGMLGGAALAMLLSIVTIVLGVGFGVAFQLSASNAKGGGWFGRIFAALLLGATIFYLLLLTLARVAGEAGDTEMFATAAREVQVRPFSGLLDLPALAYCFFTIGVIALIYTKFIQIMGHYRGLRSRRLALNEAEVHLEDTRDDLVEDSQEEIDRALEKLQAAPDHIQEGTRAISELAMHYENVVDQLRDDAEQLRDASRLLLRIIRIRSGSRESAEGLTIDFDTPISKAEERLLEFKAEAARLEDWEEVDIQAVEKCGEELITVGQTKLAEIEAECENVRKDRYRALGGIAPPLQSESDNDNVEWLPVAAAR